MMRGARRWQKTGERTLRCTVMLTGEEMAEIQSWCEQNNCGLRTSFTDFKFKNAQDIVAFLLRWS